MSYLIIVRQCGLHQNTRLDNSHKFVKTFFRSYTYNISVGKWEQQNIFYCRNVLTSNSPFEFLIFILKILKSFEGV